MLHHLLFVALILVSAPSAVFAASSSSDALGEKPCCQQKNDWNSTKKSRCTDCHTRYFDEVYSEYSDELPRKLQPRYISDYLSEIIKTLNFRNDRRTLPLLKRMLEKIPQKYVSESARLFFYAEENPNMSIECLQLLQEYGADLNAQDERGQSMQIVNLMRRILLNSSAQATRKPTAATIIWPNEGHSAEMFRDEMGNHTVRFFRENGSLISEQNYTGQTKDERETDEEGSSDAETSHPQTESLLRALPNNVINQL